MNTKMSQNMAWTLNKKYSTSLNQKDLSFFTKEAIKQVIDFQQTHPAYTQTPLYSLKQLANHLNVEDIKVKDESKRFGLNAFKVLGGIYAIGKYIAEQLGRNIADLSFTDLQSKEVKEKIGQVTFISATDGNHGKGVAWAARELGQKAIIYLPKGSANTRLEAISEEGQEAKITDINYDETVKLCSNLADENGWVLVQDTAWGGYEQIPLWIMQGYATIAAEIIEDLTADNEAPPTHIFLQAGVGSFAAS